MIPWKAAYQRCLNTGALKRAFSGDIPEGNFLLRAYSLRFTSDVAAPVPSAPALAVSTAMGTYGPVSGPVLRTFVSGAIILGITATAIQIQTVAGGFGYGLSNSQGRRDLFGLNIEMTNTGNVTATGMTMAAALLGNGGGVNGGNEFPIREMLLQPNQGLRISAANLSTTNALNVTVVIHAATPRNR